MNKYRVDRNDHPTHVPIGMNSILYIGDSLVAANKQFNTAKSGIDDWGIPNKHYGVTLSVWNSLKYQYQVIRSKDIPDVTNTTV